MTVIAFHGPATYDLATQGGSVILGEGNAFMRGRWRSGLALALALTILLGACDVENGSGYGAVLINGANRRICGSSTISRNSSNIAPRVHGIGITWYEPTSTAGCRSTEEVPPKYQVPPGYLGHAVYIYENGVLCSSMDFEYNGASAYFFKTARKCIVDHPADNYQTKVAHRWWKPASNSYAGLTQQSVIITA